EQIAGYSASESAAVSLRLRSEASREGVIDQLLELYQAVQAEQRLRPTDLVAEQRAAAAYVRWLGDDRRKTYQFLHQARPIEAVPAQRNAELCQRREPYQRIEPSLAQRNTQRSESCAPSQQRKMGLAQRTAELAERRKHLREIEAALAHREADLAAVQS